MYIDFVELVGKKIEVELSGGIFHKGVLIDCGLDILVIYSNYSFLYIPFTHVQKLKETSFEDNDLSNSPPSEKPIETDVVSYRKALTVAKGMHVQIYVTGKKAIHGTLGSIMNDYFVFHSPVYKTMYIPLNHIKWLIPYPANKTPYSLDKDSPSLAPELSIPVARSFTEQLKKLENKLVMIDVGEHSDKIGVLQKFRNNKITLISADGERIYRNVEHIKTIHLL
ncbi:hypothetical protein [Bacillus timonensis]|uniref:hypothetical protein n=1 Tax=Bacillus timonensis TaxID=1033734 RepID=UPI000287F39A|nr:hypothetical protein [Bacillus timonensis]